METLTVTIETDTHTHGGKRCAKGEKISVNRTGAQFLLRAGVIQKIPASLGKKEKTHE